MQRPVENQIRQPMEHQIQQPVEHRMQQPMEHRMQQPMEHQMQQPMEHRMQQPMEHQMQQPMEHQMQQPMDQQMQQPIEHKMQQSLECSWCGSAAVHTCSRCNEAHYCSRDHQRQDYGDHSFSCRNYRIHSTADQGQHIVASCGILPGNKILSDVPIVVGPMATSDLVCLSCYTPITNKDFYRCPDCSWPMCDKVCSYADTHALECDVLAQDKSGIGVPQGLGETPRYDLIILLRGLFLRDSNPEAWKTIMAMESHYQTRKDEKDPFHNAAVRYFTEVCKVDFDVDVIHHVRGAIVTNCVIFRGHKNNSLRALYPTIRLFNHSCVPNVHLSTIPDGEIEARAAVTINKNEPMTICYTGTMEPLWKRQQNLTEVYKFQCKCKRCVDPTELGTCFSSPRCPDCRRSFMLPPGDGSVDFWICESCGLKYEFIDVMQEVSEWLYRMDMNDVINGKSPKQLEKEVDRLHDSFNYFHYVPLQYTQALLGTLKESSYQSLKLRLEIWENHFKIYDKLEPGFTRRRGVTLYQIAVSTLSMARAAVAEKELYPSRIPELLQEALVRLRESASIMQLEPKLSLERKWIYIVKNTATEIEKYREELIAHSASD